MTDPGTPGRPTLIGVEGEGVVRVVLGLGRWRVTGEERVTDQSGRAAAVAAATIEAVVQLLPDAASARLAWCRLVRPDDATGPPVCVVVVTVDLLGVTMQYSGSAVVRDQLDVATAKAVLQALNRRLEVMGLDEP